MRRRLGIIGLVVLFVVVAVTMMLRPVKTARLGSIDMAFPSWGWVRFRLLGDSRVPAQADLSLYLEMYHAHGVEERAKTAWGLLSKRDIGSSPYLIQAIAYRGKVCCPGIILYVLSEGDDLEGVELYRPSGTPGGQVHAKYVLWHPGTMAEEPAPSLLVRRILLEYDCSSGLQIRKEQTEPSDQGEGGDVLMPRPSGGPFLLQVYDKEGNRSNTVEIEWGGGFI